MQAPVAVLETDAQGQGCAVLEPPKVHLEPAAAVRPGDAAAEGDVMEGICGVVRLQVDASHGLRAVRVGKQRVFDE